VTQPVKKPRTKRRTASKQERQTQLIKATIRSIAKHGLSVTTMATVAKEAKLSQGIINLHFQSKERLLEETLLYIVGEYRDAWHRARDNNTQSVAATLAELAGVDFDKRICQRNKLAVWFAFWGETRSRSTYRKICTQSSREYKQDLTRLCTEIIRQGRYPVPAEHVANGILAINGGLWLDLLLTPGEMSREQALEVSQSYLRGVFPGHFPA
jgi:TetR/AcrR family transcriptional repressor of bet genes